MAKQTFTAGQVLTAAQVNNLQTDIFNQTTSTKTANYTLVVGDRGTRVIGNGTSITFTVDNSIFTAGDTIKLHNINSTVLTIAAGVGVTINAAAGLTIAQYQEATLFATSASSFILFESTASSAQGLTLLNTTSFSGVASQSVSDVFSATYTAYKIIIRITDTASDGFMNLRFRVSGTDTSSANYSSAYYGISAAFLNDAGGNSAQTSAYVGYSKNTAEFAFSAVELVNPFLTQPTIFNSIAAYKNQANNITILNAGGGLDNTTSYTGFTLLMPGGGNATGVVSTYGYNL
jgi:hypothetical protein